MSENTASIESNCFNSDKKSQKNQEVREEYVYPENFELAYKHVAGVEGGLADHKNDPGGVTKYGVSLRFLEDYGKTKHGRKVLTEIRIFSVDRRSIVELTKEQAKRILYNAFWLSPKIYKLPLYLSIITYDYAINSGSFYGVKVLQKAIGTSVDGVIGSETLKMAFQADTEKSAKLMLEERAKYYMRLCQQKPKLKVFRRGWLNRIEKLTEYINKLFKSYKARKLDADIRLAFSNKIN